jgi:hypothetical protein
MRHSRAKIQGNAQLYGIMSTRFANTGVWACLQDMKLLFTVYICIITLNAFVMHGTGCVCWAVLLQERDL